MGEIEVGSEKIDIAELEKATNEAGGYIAPTASSSTVDEGEVSDSADNASVSGQEEVSHPEENENASESTDEGQAEASDVADGQAKEMSEQEQTLMKDIRSLKEVSGTPFKSVPDLVSGYKNIQTELTKVTTRIKPFEGVIQQALTDPLFMKTMGVVIESYNNPEAMQMYLEENSDNSPNPMDYNFGDPSEVEEFQRKQSEYIDRKTNRMIDRKFASIDAEKKMDRLKSDLKSKYPESDPNKVLEYASNLGKDTPLDVFYKSMTYDEMKSGATTRARNDIISAAEAAGKNKTPLQGNSRGSEPITDRQVVDHVFKYGYESAVTKYGKSRAMTGLKEGTNVKQ